jgi:hypothetical protein
MVCVVGDYMKTKAGDSPFRVDTIEQLTEHTLTCGITWLYQRKHVHCWALSAGVTGHLPNRMPKDKEWMISTHRQDKITFLCIDLSRSTITDTDIVGLVCLGDPIDYWRFGSGSPGFVQIRHDIAKGILNRGVNRVKSRSHQRVKIENILCGLEQHRSATVAGMETTSTGVCHLCSNPGMLDKMVTVGGDVFTVCSPCGTLLSATHAVCRSTCLTEMHPVLTATSLRQMQLEPKPHKRC